MFYKNYFNNLTEECGVFGIINAKQASQKIYMGLHSLQHRGQDASGIVTFKDDKVYECKRKDSIVNSFNEDDVNNLIGTIGIGHVRYPTFGSKHDFANIQPFIFKKNGEYFAIAHNGNLTNAETLRKELEEDGVKFMSNSDSEILGHLMIQNKDKDLMTKLKACFNKIVGAYTYLIAYKDKLIAVRDPYGIRPLVLGKLKNEYIFTSESVALDINGAKLLQDIKPGEIVIIDKKNKIKHDFICKERHSAICAMEYIYFSRPDSIIEGINVHKARVQMGKELAKEHPIKADIVIGVPDSSLSAALGYSQQSKIPYEYGLIKNKYIGRSFIAPSQTQREKMIKMKLNPNINVVQGKNIILVDDSIVRGTTMMGIVKLLKDAGAKQIHIRIASPEIKFPSFYGINIQDKRELALYKFTKKEYLKKLKYVDSLEFLSINGLQKVLQRDYKKKELEASCFTGFYPIALHDYERIK